MSEAVADFPAPFVAMRTLKSDPIVGVPPYLAEENLEAEDPSWRVNGKRGVIQAVLSPSIDRVLPLSYVDLL